MKKRRITWSDLPEAVTGWVETTLGSPVVQWRSQTGGWSPGTADRLVCADGSRAFLKAVHPSLNDVTPSMYRDEIRVAQFLGPGVPCAHLLDSYDGGAWVAMLFEDIEGRHPRAPWRERELAAVLEALDDVVRATTPLTSADLPDAGEVYAESFRGLARMTPAQRAELDAWEQENLGELVERGERAGRIVVGDSLGHADLRADNILVQPDGRVRIVDWPNACRSKPWVDGVLMASNIENLGGLRDGSGGVIDSLDVLRPWARGHGASDDDMLDALVGLLGYFEHASRQAPVPGLPTLRRDQAVSARATLRVVQRLWTTTRAAS